TSSAVPRATGGSSLITRLPPPPRLAATTSTSASPAIRRDPTSNQRSSSLASSTTTDPSSPCGRPTRPTTTRLTSLGNLDEHPPAFADGGGAHDRAQRTHDPATAADHLADVVRGDVQAQDER